jgi:hypothetical protein
MRVIVHRYRKCDWKSLDRVRGDNACDSAPIQEVRLEELRRNTCSDLKCKFLC